jgi:hypothetical protein
MLKVTRVFLQLIVTILLVIPPVNSWLVHGLSLLDALGVQTTHGADHTNTNGNGNADPGKHVPWNLIGAWSWMGQLA